MRRGWLYMLLTVGCALAGCKRDGAAASAAVDGGRTRSAEEAPGNLSAAQLTAYVRYQRAMVEVYDALFRELERLGKNVDGGPSGIPPQVRVVETKALAEEQARQDAGLTEAELAWIEPLVLEVLNARALARSLDAQGQLAELEAMRDQLQGEAREGLEQTLLELREEQAEAARLTAVRAKYGDANVDQVLSQEPALAENYELWLKKISG